MKKVVFYARSASSRLGVDRQIQRMQAFLPPGDDVVGRYSDVGSAMDSHKPGLRQALHLLENGEAEARVMQSVDRLSRTVQELARLASMFRIELMED